MTSQDLCVEYGVNENEVHNILQRLDQLSKKLDSYEPLLYQNVLSAEFEITANFSTLIGLLNDRQKNLTTQLHNIAKEKGLLIRSHKQSIDTLRTTLLPSCFSKASMDFKIHDYMERAESMILTSNLTPFISFKAESEILSQTLLSYGRLVDRYPGHFADPSKPSVCLPRDLEEEDDHVEESQPVVLERGACSCVDPKLSKWLSSSGHRCSGFHSLSFEDNNNANGSSADISNIYSKDQTKSEIVQHLKQSSFKSSVHLPYYQPNSTLVRTWLELRSDYKGPENVDPDTKLHQDLSTTSDSFELLNTYSHPNNFKEWLFSDPVELCDMPGLNANCCAQTRTNSWIRSTENELHHTLAQVTLQDVISKQPPVLSDASRWLVTSNPPSNDNLMKLHDNSRLCAKNTDETENSQSRSFYGHPFIPSIGSVLPENEYFYIDGSKDNNNFTSVGIVEQLDKIAKSELQHWIAGTHIGNSPNKKSFSTNWNEPFFTSSKI